MEKIRNLLLKCFKDPSDLELAILYMLLGFYFVVATDSVIPFCWVTFTTVSLYIAIFIIFLRFILFIAVLKKGNVPRKAWVRWGQLGFITLIIILLFCTNLGICLRLIISKQAMLKEVDQAFSTQVDFQGRLFETGPVPVDLFAIRIYKVDSVNRTVWFHTEDGNSAFWIPSLMGGIVYCEQGRPAGIPETNYQHLWGPWWRWVQDI